MPKNRKNGRRQGGSGPKNDTHKTQNDTISNDVLEFPALGHQLRVRRLGERYGGEWVRVSPSFGQRVARFGLMFVEGVVVTIVVLAFLYLPDVVADYSHRGGEFMSFFGKYIAAVTGAVSVFAAFAAVLRDTVICIDTKNGRVVCAGRLTEARVLAAVRLADMTYLNVSQGSSLTGRRRITATFGDAELVLADTLGGGEDINGLYGWIAWRRAN